MEAPASPGNRRNRAAVYPKLDPREPIRIAFVGQTTYFRACALLDATGGLTPTFVEWRTGAPLEPMLDALSEVDPDVVVAFRPDIVPPGAFDGLRAITVGYLTEPLPRAGDPDHPDLLRRLDEMRAVDPSNFDRIIAFDPRITGVARSVVPIWRAVPLPVADMFFRPLRELSAPGRALFVGRSTEHREEFLTRAKHEFDLIHLAHGISNEEILPFLDGCGIGINLHNEPYPSFENRVCLHLAAGHLVISETLSPTHGLEPGLDYVEVQSPTELYDALYHAIRRPSAFRRIRIYGRRKAEYFRASRVYPRLVTDLLLDLEVFGRGRTRQVISSAARR
jgi:hypothetical protein